MRIGPPTTATGSILIQQATATGSTVRVCVKVLKARFLQRPEACFDQKVVVGVLPPELASRAGLRAVSAVARAEPALAHDIDGALGAGEAGETERGPLTAVPHPVTPRGPASGSGVR